MGYPKYPKWMFGYASPARGQALLVQALAIQRAGGDVQAFITRLGEEDQRLLQAELGQMAGMVADQFEAIRDAAQRAADLIQPLFVRIGQIIAGMAPAEPERPPVARVRVRRRHWRAGFNRYRRPA